MSTGKLKTLRSMRAMNEIFKGISNYAVANKGNEEGYRHLRAAACEAFGQPHIDQPASETFMAFCREGEDEFCEVNYSNEPAARHTSGKRNGEWKYRTLLPQAYNSAKSALRKALDAGIDPAGRGKSELEKLTKEQTAVEKSPQTKLREAADLFLKRLGQTGSSEVNDQQVGYLLGELSNRGFTLTGR